MTDETPGPDGIDVPDQPPDPEADDHVLPDDALRYPDLHFDGSGLDPESGFFLSADPDREVLGELLDDLAAALDSHDLGVTADDGHVVFGIAPDETTLDYEPDDEGERTGELELSVRLRAKVMVQSDDPEEKTGSRAGRGFVPLAELTGDDDRQFRCYNWVEDPFEPSSDDADSG